MATRPCSRNSNCKNQNDDVILQHIAVMSLCLKNHMEVNMLKTFRYLALSLQIAS